MKNIIATERQNGPKEQGFTEQQEGYITIYHNIKL